MSCVAASASIFCPLTNFIVLKPMAHWAGVRPAVFSAFANSRNASASDFPIVHTPFVGDIANCSCANVIIPCYYIPA